MQVAMDCNSDGRDRAFIAYRILIQKPVGKRRPRKKLDNYDVKEMGCEDVRMGGAWIWLRIVPNGCL
jgi:hypothetical protein